MGVVSRRCVCLVGVVVRRYIDFLILLIPTPLVSVFFAAASLLFVHFFWFFLYIQVPSIHVPPADNFTVLWLISLAVFRN